MIYRLLGTIILCGKNKNFIWVFKSGKKCYFVVIIHFFVTIHSND